MEEYLMTLIKKTSIFMILAQAFIHFRPSAVYEKYFKFLIGIMTTVILVIPVMELFHSGTLIEYQEKLHYYMEELEKVATQELPEAVSPETEYLSIMSEEVKTRLNKMLLEEGYQLKDVEITEEGMIKLLLVSIGKENSDIQIPEITLSKSNEEKDLERRAMEVLELETDGVEVEIVE